MISGFLTRQFNRIPARYMRFRKTALAISVASYVPFLAGGYIAVDTVVQEKKPELAHAMPIKKTGTVLEAPPAEKYKWSFYLMVGSYLVGSPATAYYAAAQIQAYRRPRDRGVSKLTVSS